MLRNHIADTAQREAKSCKGKATRLKMICGIGIDSTNRKSGSPELNYARAKEIDDDAYQHQNQRHALHKQFRAGSTGPQHE